MLVNFSEVEFWQTVSFKTEVESPFICLLPCRFAVMQEDKDEMYKKALSRAGAKFLFC